MPQRSWRSEGAPGRGDDLLAHADALYNLARYLTRDPSEAEDLVQETYMRALRSWSDFAPGTNVKAWLFRILRNAFISRYRYEHRRAPPTPHDAVEEAGEDATEPPPGPGADSEQLRRVVAGEIEAALRTLSEEARTVILLDVEGFTETEAAMVLGCAVGTVKSRLSRARAVLRSKLADYATGGRP